MGDVWQRPGLTPRDRSVVALAALPAAARQTAFSKGTFGLRNSEHFVISYREGRVPQLGIIILGQATGDVSISDRPGPVTVRVPHSGSGDWR